MRFLNKTVEQIFASPHTTNAHAKISGIGWVKIRASSADGVTNVFLLLTAAKAHGHSVSGTVESDEITELYLG